MSLVSTRTDELDADPVEAPPDIPAGIERLIREASERPARRSHLDTALLIGMALALWVTVLFVGRLWGQLIYAQGRDMILYTPPILGNYRWEHTPAMLLPLPVAVALVAGLPVVARRLSWRAMCAAGMLACLIWGVALAVIDGNEGLVLGLEFEREYQPYIDAILRAPGEWLAGFIDLVPDAGVQVRAHPPGLPLLLAAMAAVGLEGPGWAAGLVLAVAVSTVPAVLVTLRQVCGEVIARRAMPFVAAMPGIVFVFTSFDALYMGVSAWFVAAIVIAANREGHGAVRWAVAAGVLAAAAIMGSYGMVLMGCVPVFVAVRRRAWRALAIAAATAFVCILAFVPFGYWWLSGLGATREAYYALGLDRPYAYFQVNNLSALALVVGPAAAAGLAVARDRRLWLLLGGTLLAMLVANLSGLSTGEIERIWLPFAVWLVPVCAVLATRDRDARVWLGVQIACPLVLLFFIRPLW